MVGCQDGIAGEVEQLSELEAGLKAEGCRDAPVVCNGTLLDGHNHKAQGHANCIDYETTAIDPADRGGAEVRIIDNQFAR